jgi:hypothetical protein
MKIPFKLNLKKLCFVIVIILPSITFSQKNYGDSLKFKIIQETISFLAKDKSTFKNSSGKPASCKILDYGCLEKYLEAEKIEAQSQLKVWKSKHIISQKELTDFKKSIVIEITTGAPNKIQRTSLNDYPIYLKKIDGIVNQFEDKRVVLVDKPQNINPDIEIKDTNTQNTEEQLNSVNDQLPNEENSVNANSNDSFIDNEEIENRDILPLVSFLFSLLSLGIGVYLLLKRKRKSSNKTNTNKYDNHIYPDTLDPLKQSIKNQKADLDKISDNLKNMDSSILQLQNRIKALEVLLEKKGDKEETSVYSRKIENSLKYAKYPNMSNGFTNDALRDSQNGEMIYEIEIQGNQASFYISSNTSAQSFALTDVKELLGDACDFINQPSKGCEIYTKTKGTLIKSNGNWIILNKSIIEFK